MAHHTQLPLLGVLLFLTVVTSVDAVLTYIAGEYFASSDPAILTPVSTYITGFSLALEQDTSSTSLVSYTWYVSGVQPGGAMDMYVSFSQKTSCLAMFGPAGRLAVSALFSSIGNNTFPCFAPMAQTQTDTSSKVYFPAFQSQVYWTLPSSQAQAAALMFLLSQMDLFAIQQYSIRTSNTFVCEPVQKLLPQLAPTLGAKLSAGMYGTPNTVNYIQNNNVRLLYVNTQTERNAADSIKELLASSVAISMNITYATSYELAHLSLEIYKSLNPSGGLLPYGNIFLSMPVPGVEAKEYIASQNFVEQAGSLLNAKTNVLKDIMMAGWASGLALTVALNKYTGSTFNSKAAFYNNLRNAQSSFLVGELFIGSFGICSSPMAWTQGAVCACHTGGNNVWMHTFTKQGSTYDTKPVSGSLFQYGLGMCANVRATSDNTYTAPNTTDEIFRLPRTVHLLGMSLSDDAMTSYMCSQTYNTIARLANTSLFWHRSTHALRGYCLPSTTAKAPSDFTTHTGTYVTTAMMGIIPDTLLTSSTLPTGMILDFIPQTTQPRLAVANYIYVFPTLDQELFVLMSYVSGLMAGASGVCGVVRSSTKSSMTAQLLSDTLRQYGVDSTSVQQQPSGSLASSIGASCLYTFVVDAAAADASLLAKYLQEHQTSTLLVPFDDITKQYASFLAAFGSLPETVTKRLVFATNLPAWTGTTMSAADLGKARALNTVEEYVQTLAPIDQTPSAARAFVVAMLYDQLTRGTVWGQHNLQAALYGNVTLTLSGGMKIGPFTTTWPGANNKLINYGATDIAVWSFTRVVVPTTPLLAPPVTPPLAYMTASSAAMSDANRALGLRAVDPNTGEDCMPLQASSSFSRDETVRSPSSSASLPMTTPQTNSTGSAESSTPHSSSSTNVLIMLQWILVILLLLVVMYIAVLLLVACGALTCVWRLFASARCLRGKPACAKAAKKFRSCVDGEHNEDVVLQHAARNTSCAPDSSKERLACVVVEVDNWRALWVREAESMSRAMRHYQCCVRRAVVKSQCYEMLCVEGLFVVVCATVDDGVNVACDVVRDVAGLATHDASAINAAYVRCGCGANSVPGLRLRVAVHCGTGIRRMDESGRILWGGAAVEDAVRAACAAGGVGVVVLTASAKSAYTGSTPLLPCGRLGIGPASEELFAAWILGDATADERRDRCTRKGGNAEAALFLVAAESEASSAPSRNVCKKSLERHYESIAECDRLDDLKWMSQRFALRILQQPEDMNEHDRYAALLNAVSRHLGSLMECRHGVPRASSRMRSRTVKIDGVDHSCASSKISRGSGTRFNRSSRRSHSMRKEHMTNFSYPRQREEEL